MNHTLSPHWDVNFKTNSNVRMQTVIDMLRNVVKIDFSFSIVSVKKCSSPLKLDPSIVKMSLVTYKQPNQLTADVLLVIFDQLDDQDLLRCEVVCRQWRNVLLSGRPWKTLFHRQIVSPQQWRNVLQNFGVDVDKLKTVHYSLHYRGLCRAIIKPWSRQKLAHGKVQGNCRNNNSS